MRRSSLLLPSVLAGSLLLTACGSQTAGARSDGLARSDDSSCGRRSSGTPVVPGTAAATGTSQATGAGSGSGSETDGVGLTRSSRGGRDCTGFTGFEVTNNGNEPLTYTITFAFLSDSGETVSDAEQTVPSVEPGRTVERGLPVSGQPSDTGTEHVRIIKVRSIPTDEAPSASGPCPRSGVHLYADDGDAAMGLRVVGLRLENCGTRVTRLDGYPQVRLLDEAHRPVQSVKILHGGSAIATGTGADGTPRTLLLKPGERAHAVLTWRNTVDSTTDSPVNAPYARVWAKPGAAPVTVTPEFDLGTTGKLGVGPWKKDGTDTGQD